jgi:hypothetical protein
MKVLIGLIVASTTCFAVGCGSSLPAPTDQVSQTEAAIRAAQEVGAPGIPKAALHLKMARDQLVTAQGLMSEDENEEAKLVLERARVDAELAIALSKEASLRAQAADALDKVKKLRAEAEAQSASAGK